MSEFVFCETLGKKKIKHGITGYSLSTETVIVIDEDVQVRVKSEYSYLCKTGSTSATTTLFLEKNYDFLSAVLESKPLAITEHQRVLMPFRASPKPAKKHHEELWILANKNAFDDVVKELITKHRAGLSGFSIG